jgi:hypothetical protein
VTTFTYGVADRLDLGVTLPFVSATLDATVDERILRLGTAATPTVHSFDGTGASTTSRTAGGTASGLGDVGVRAKYNLVRRETVGVAAGLDARFPTGDAENLLGNGTIFGRAYGIVSGGTREFSPHVNAGFTFASGQFRRTTAVYDPATSSITPSVSTGRRCRARRSALTS